MSLTPVRPYTFNKGTGPYPAMHPRHVVWLTQAHPGGAHDATCLPTLPLGRRRSLTATGSNAGLPRLATP
ncbi:hypothetical protein GCM10023080_081270 [Streptomyces pseudoechinosporeus]